MVVRCPQEETNVAFVDVEFSASAVLEFFPKGYVGGDGSIDSREVIVCVNRDGCGSVVNKC